MYDDFDNHNFDGMNREAEMNAVYEERSSLWRTAYLLALSRLLKSADMSEAKRANEEALLIAKSAMDNYTVLFLQPVGDDDGDGDDDE